jgi:phospholipid N-methyltransferase
MSSPFFEFFKAALKNPLQLSTAFETGPRVGRRFARHIDVADGQAVVEFGVGAGAITVHIIPRLARSSDYIGFELNPDLYKYLKEIYPKFEIYNESAENLELRLKGRKAGAIVSTLPWSLLTKEIRTSIVNQSYENLEPGGLFATFVAHHVLWTPAAQDFIRQVYQTFPDVTYEDEFLNVPPCRLFFARKPKT